MSVYIQGINRPTEPEKCNFYQNDPLGIRLPYCALQLACYGLDKCPLIQVPEHGRLIDADEIVKDQHLHYEYLSDKYYVTVQDIENATTIIPADNEGE